MKLHRLNFRDLKGDLSNFRMVRLVIIWMFEFCMFVLVPRCGPWTDYLILFKDSTLLFGIILYGLYLWYIVILAVLEPFKVG